MNPAEQEIRRRIGADGSIAVADYMEVANTHYYASRDPLGRGGDFITAPEISQMFGELVGLWLADLWARAGAPRRAAYVELGPGRGSLTADALRATRAAGLEPPVHLVETSPVLRAAQAARLPDALWHEDVEDLPRDGPLLIVANEFFDALPIVQRDEGGRPLQVRLESGRFVRDPAVIIFEHCPAAQAVVASLARRLIAQGGALLIVDYGYGEPATGDTLQAVARHAFADPWEAPGERDLTAHVDFGALARTARTEGLQVFGPTGQGDWLERMGINLRAAALARSHPDRTEEIAAARDRLISPGSMGRLFRVMALVAPAWPAPEGF